MEIASITGLSRSAVNIALAVLESSGAIRRDYGAVRIIDSQQLRQS
jgi:DNA-binding GntR family transcriptional regulator